MGLEQLQAYSSDTNDGFLNNMKVFYTEETDASPMFLLQRISKQYLTRICTSQICRDQYFQALPLFMVCRTLNCLQGNKSYVSQTTIWGTLAYTAKSVH
jgi:hypothetical protein